MTTTTPTTPTTPTATTAPTTATVTTPDPPIAPPGLKGLLVADTALGDVQGAAGFYHYRQYAAPDLARSRSLEDVWHLLLFGSLPADESTSRDFARSIGERRQVPGEVLAAVPAIAAASDSVATALRTALSLRAAAGDPVPLVDATPARRREQVLDLAASLPALVAAIHRARAGLDPVEVDPTRGLAEDYLHLLTGRDHPAEIVRALEQYLILGIDHGFNASTFTARVVTSTGSDLGSALVAALGSLLGPRHGGAPSRALDTLDAIGTPDRADAWVRERVERGERIMGFGHPVYVTRDPRSEMLRGIAQDLGGATVDFAVQVEATIEATLAELKPDRALHANVEWYAAVVMDRCGLPRDLFTPTFAISRVIGWGAHILEQATDPRIIRPSSRYVGPTPPAPVPSLRA